MTKLKSFAVLVCGALLASCGDAARQTITAPASGAYIKFFNFGVNTPGVNFFANDAKVTAIASSSCAPPNDTTLVCRTTGNPSTNGTASGSAANGGFYSALTPGQYALTGKIAATTDNGFPISTVSSTLESGKSYSYFISGIYNTTSKTAEAFVVEDAIPATMDFTVATVRFVNAISNATPQTLYAKSTVTGVETAIGGAVAYKSAGAFTTLPPGVYDLVTRTPGSTVSAIARTGVSFSGGRVYTIASRGDMTVTSTTATTRPQLDNTANR